jgi:ABC-type phosphate/phosphonate transport system substrate-binding protein
LIKTNSSQIENNVAIIVNYVQNRQYRQHQCRRPALWILACALLIALATWVRGNPSGPDTPGLISGKMTAGFSEQVFAGVIRSDFEAAFKTYMVIVGRQRGWDLITETQIFKRTADFETAIRAGRVQLLIIPCWDYLSMDIQDDSDPYFVGVGDTGILKRCLLLTQKNSGLNSFEDLRGKSITILDSMNSILSVKWMETVLLEEKLGAPETFFSRVEKVTKSSSAVLPVFFGKHDACIVDQPAFETLKELNPQIGERLHVAAISEPLLNTIVCLSKSGWVSAKQRKDTILSLPELNASPSGQQILTLFKVNKLAPFKPEYLDGVNRLKATHDRKHR